MRAQEHANVSVYDPVFSEEDNRLFEQLQIRVLPENQASDHLLAPATRALIPGTGGQVSIESSNNIMGKAVS